MKKLLLAASFALLALSAAAQSNDNNLDTLVVTTNPQMHCSSCENRIKQNIRFVSGTKKITTSISAQQVTIIYDRRKASPDDYANAFAKIGYKITLKQ